MDKNDKNRENTLKKLFTDYSNDFKEALELYEKLRSEAKESLPVVPFKTDPKLYSDPLCVMTIMDKINEETQKLPGFAEYNKKRKLEIKEKKDSAKKQKLEELKNDPNAFIKCKNCSKIETILNIYSKANDGNSFVLPSKKEVSGYLPNFGGITDSNGLLIDICVECGTIQNLDLEMLKKDVKRAEHEARENDGDSNSSYDSSYDSNKDE